MKATLRWGMGLVGLLLVSSFAHAYIWVTPVYWCPYPQAPNTSNSGFYLMDSQGRWTGPHYYLVPPNPPFRGVVPGPVGSAIMSGNLPHTLLMSKQGMTLGNVPMLPDQRQGILNFGGPNHAGAAPMGNPGMQYAMGQPPMRPMQVPYGAPPGQYAGMPPYGMMPAPMPYPGQVPAQPVAWQNPGVNAWPTSNAHSSPFGPIPSHHPHAHMPPGRMQPMSPMQQFTPMQLPGMDSMPPPQQPPCTAFPMHPFTRSPRDFFMWGENMEDEARMRNRPFPVPR